MAGKAKVSYERVSPTGVRQAAGHLAEKVQQPKSRKAALGRIKLQPLQTAKVGDQS